MQKNEFEEFVLKAIETAKGAGEIHKRGLEERLELEKKGAIDLVTKIDRESEAFITGSLSKAFPDHDIIAEEGTRHEHSSKFTWYIDPLDGTTNYAYHLPWFAVSIGLFRGGSPVAGVVYNPAINEMFHAVKGGGAFLNGKRISVSNRRTLDTSLLATGFPYYIREKCGRVISNLEKFLISTRGVRRYGAAALDLAYVAAGRYDGFWEEGLHPWDTAAGILLVKEAGGKVTDYTGSPYDIYNKTIIASNGIIHEEMESHLKGTVAKV